MIQRIQSVWLLLASLLLLLTLKFAFYSGTLMPENVYTQLTGTSTIPLLVLTILASIISFVAIFLYRKRGLQVRLCVAAILLDLLLVYLYYREVVKFNQGAYTVTAVLHLLVLIFLWLSIRGIRSDEKLIRDSDRLR